MHRQEARGRKRTRSSLSSASVTLLIGVACHLADRCLSTEDAQGLQKRKLLVRWFRTGVPLLLSSILQEHISGLMFTSYLMMEYYFIAQKYRNLLNNPPEYVSKY